jgi:cell division protein FtsN
VALVKLKLLEDPALANRRYGVQVGAFQDRANAERLQSRVSREHVPVEVREEGGLYRVLVGAEPTEAAANSLAQELRRIKLFGMVVLVR